MNNKLFFLELFNASTESAVDDIVQSNIAFRDPSNWRPYGQIESNYGVVENQQSSPIPALVEKVINSIDAILTRRCLEEGLDPKSTAAPRSIHQAVTQFFPNSKNWDLSRTRQVQAERIQIIADGPRMETSLVIYDDGEGQHPEDFEDTFLSLLRGNKNEIHFVQGKYNMGGAGAIVFCGKKRYQLIGSRRWDQTGNFGFTLIRRHPLTPQESRRKRATWYEYFAPNSRIPSFPITELDLGLRNRKFTTGTVIKLYSYDLPRGSRSVISRDLNQSLNEYLFEPALPLFTIDQLERYPRDRNLQRDLYGLKRRLEEDGNKYVAERFSQDLANNQMGNLKTTTYVFRPRVADKSVRETRDTIRREFFKNNMSIIFSINGQVHGHYTTEFITRSLKYQLLKHYLVIHVDCTNLRMEFRDELFMASRDRLKDGAESRLLRKQLAGLLRSGRLKEVYKERKAAISVESKDTQDLLRSFTQNLPFQDDLARLLGQTYNFHDRRRGKHSQRKRRKTTKSKGDRPAFSPKRFPTFFKIRKAKNANSIPTVRVPLGGKRSIRFSTDVEDEYFDRVSEPGKLSIALLGLSPNNNKGGDRPGLPRRLDEILNVVKSSPHNGTIRLAVNPTKEVEVGDAIKIRAELSSPGQDYQEIFFVKITDPEKTTAPSKKGKTEPDPNIGFPKLMLVRRDAGSGDITWEQLNDQGIEMDHDAIVHLQVDESNILGTIYVNLDSRVLLNHRSRLSSHETIEIAQKRYISGVYFHSLFLYAITQNKRYTLQREHSDSQPVDVDVGEYLRDLFASHYAEFLLNFEVQELIASLES